MSVEKILKGNIDDLNMDLFDVELDESDADENKQETETLGEIQEDGTIRYTDFCVINLKTQPKEIKHDEIINYDFSQNAFYEVIRDQKFVRPFFDFDSIDTPEKLQEVIKILEQLSDVWGPWASLGYTNKKENENEELDIIFNEKANKTSFHVYFHMAKMTREEAHKLHTEQKRLNDSAFDYDGSVYKAQGKQQVFRCPLSLKLEWNEQTKEIITHKEKAAECPMSSCPDWYVAQCNGKETHTATFEHLAEIIGVHEVPTYEQKQFGRLAGRENSGSAFTLEQFEIIYKGLANTEI
jgi:hypothetical protein